jgi:PAS domain S-box-containing protein
MSVIDSGVIEQAAAVGIPQSLPRVLLIDDQPARLLTYEVILEGVGVECVRALSGKEALERLLKQEFAAILLDVSMPEMDGFETARLIRDHPRCERTPIIFVTAVYVTQLDVMKGYAVGAIDYIQVPIVPEILRSKVTVLVELYRRRAQLEKLNGELEEARATLEVERARAVKRGETQLREREERYRAIFEHPTECTLVLEAVRRQTGEGLEWRCMDANSNCLSLLRLARVALVGRRLGEILPDFADKLIPLCARVLSERQPYRYEEDFRGRVLLMCLFPIGQNIVVLSGVDITAKSEAEREEQRRSRADRAEKEWLTAVLNSMNEEVYFTNTDKQFTYANPAAMREFGHIFVEGVELRHIVERLEVLRPDGTPRPVEESPPLRALAGEVIRDEEQIVRIPRTGELRHREVSSAPVRNSDGTIIGSVSVVRDVTEQKRIHAELRARDTRLTALVRLGDEFRSLTTPGDLAFAAARILGETLGVSRAGYGTVDAAREVTTIDRDWHVSGVTSLAGILHYRDYGTYIADLKQGKTVVCVDAKTDPRTAATAAALKAIHARSFVNVPVIENGTLVAMLFLSQVEPRVWSADELAFIRDVGERTRIAVERRRSEQAVASDLKDSRLLRDLAARLVRETDGTGLFDEILDAAVTITHADAGTMQLLDPEARQLTFVAKRGLDTELTSQFERVDATCGSPCGLALARGQRILIDFDVPEAEDPDGSRRLHGKYGLRGAQSTPLVSRGGRPLGMLSTHWRGRQRPSARELRFLDLLARQAADLIERMQAQQSLRASEQRLREDDRRKDEFIAVLAHELRNPLVPIRAGIELLKSAREKPELIDSVRPMMERQVAHTVRLIDDLLDVSRITSGKIELRRQRVTLSSLIASAVEANRAALASASLDLRVSLAEPERIIEVDPTRFSQVISNLLQNATKFTPDGGRISISGTIELAGGTRGPLLVITVRDSGVGISSQVMPTLFELFSQGHPAAPGRHSGLGIGLALARRLMELHGGSLSARSEGLGKGSEFIVRVPAPAASEPHRTADVLTRNAMEGLRVMVVDDNRDSASAMGLLVAELGADARVLYDGPTAIAAAGVREPDLVLLDIGMPGMDGYETCRHLRSKVGSGVLIAALTGWGQVQDRQRATQAGFDAHFTKPPDPADMVAWVLQTRAARGAGAHPA